MINPAMISDLFQTSYGVIKRQTATVTHEESLMQLPFRGNCLNWIIGHIVQSRNGVLELFGEQPFWGDDTRALYKRGSEPVTPENCQRALRMEALLEALDSSQARIVAAFEASTPEKMNSPLGEDSTLGEALLFQAWHESYHTGQTELLRQLTGKNDAIIK